jgi:ubiquinone/menaquinone biosynthesis C-methylase UbiE
MQRVLEPELMDTADDAQSYDAMDFSEANRRFAEDALALVAGLPQVEAIDLGTGTAQIPVLMIERRRDLSIVAADLAREMLRVAARNVEAAGMTERIQLVELDAKRVAVPSGRYDLVMSNSTLHHIPDPAETIAEIARIVKPEGAVIVRDLIRPESPEDARAIVERVAGGDSPKQKQLFFDSLCAALTVEEVAALVRASGLSRMVVARCSDRHWTAERPALVG